MYLLSRWDVVLAKITLRWLAARTRRHPPDMGRIPAGYLRSVRLGRRSHALRSLPTIVPQTRERRRATGQHRPYAEQQAGLRASLTAVPSTIEPCCMQGGPNLGDPQFRGPIGCGSTFQVAHLAGRG